jgi:hypothetical protein
MMKWCKHCGMVKIKCDINEYPLCVKCKERQKIFNNPRKYIDKFRFKEGE